MGNTIWPVALSRKAPNTASARSDGWRAFMRTLSRTPGAVNGQTSTPLDPQRDEVSFSGTPNRYDSSQPKAQTTARANSSCQKIGS